MTQIIVTIEDISIAAGVIQAIEKMKGVINTALYSEAQVEKEEEHKYSTRIQRLRGIAKGVQSEKENDDRLNYLLSK